MLDKLRDNLRTFGGRDGILYTVDRLLARLTPRWRLVRYLLVAQPVPDKPLLPATRGRTIAVRPMTEGEPAFESLPIAPDKARDRFAQGALCLGAFRDGTAIGCLWFAFDGYEEDEIACRFVPEPPAETAWDFDVYVDPSERTGLAFARLWDEANAVMRARGVRASVSRISAFNPGSLTAHARLGAAPCGTVTALRLGSVQIAWASVSPRLSIAIGRRGRPVYRITA